MTADHSAQITAALTVMLVGGFFSIVPAHGQGLSLGGVSEQRPIEISADSGIEWRQNAQVYIARGNAVAKRGAQRLDQVAHGVSPSIRFRASGTKVF